jgi:hypothetical protein
MSAKSGPKTLHMSRFWAENFSLPTATPPEKKSTQQNSIPAPSNRQPTPSTIALPPIAQDIAAGPLHEQS